MSGDDQAGSDGDDGAVEPVPSPVAPPRPPPRAPPEVFLSWRHEEGRLPEVEQIATALKDHGIRVWFDKFAQEDADGAGPPDWFDWCEEHSSAGRVLIVGTPAWYKVWENPPKWDRDAAPPSGLGVGWEARIVRGRVKRGDVDELRIVVHHRSRLRGLPPVLSGLSYHVWPREETTLVGWLRSLSFPDGLALAADIGANAAGQPWWGRARAAREIVRSLSAAVPGAASTTLTVLVLAFGLVAFAALAHAGWSGSLASFGVFGSALTAAVVFHVVGSRMQESAVTHTELAELDPRLNRRSA